MQRHASLRTGTSRTGKRTSSRVVLLTLLAAGGCEQVEQVRDHYRDLTPHEAYEASLEQAGLARTALGRAWREAAREAIEAPLSVSMPFQETGYIAPEAPAAMGYRVSIPRGRRLTAEVTLDTQEGTRVFVELFRVAADEDDPARPIVSTDSLPNTLVHEPWRGGEFVLRLQPELLRGGRYSVTLRLEAQLAFPVEGHGVRAIQSRFGVPRDGGRRAHHGVDIFARRGTPVLAAAAGIVNRVQDTNLGGKVVWMRDPVRNASLYYAHLDSQHVRSGQRVAEGDTLGFVGNTGNARTTPPHLHFGLYRRGEGPVDPFPFLDPPPSRIAELEVDLAGLGSWVRVANEGIRLREWPSLRAPVLRELERHTPIRVFGGSGAFYRVRLPDGSQGYVAGRLTEPLLEPVGDLVASAVETVRTRPDDNAPSVTTLDRGERLSILGRYGDYLYVRAPGGHLGWLGEALED